MTASDFAQTIKDGEALGVRREETYNNLKAKGYRIEGEPGDFLSPAKSGGVFNYWADVLKNGAKELGAVVKFGGEVVTRPQKALEFGRDIIKGGASLAVGAGENLYEAVTGNDVPTFNTDGTMTYSDKGTQEQRIASGVGDSIVAAAKDPLGTFKDHPLSTLSVVAPAGSSLLGRVSTLSKAGTLGEAGSGLAGLAESAGFGRTASVLSTAGKVSAALDPVNAGVQAITKGPGIATRYGKGLLGATTGAGDEAVKIAAQAHSIDGAFYQGMRGDVLEQGRILAEDSRKAITALKMQRSKQYLKTKEALTNIMEPLSGEPIYSKLSKTMKEFGISNTEKEILDSMIGMSDEQATAALNSMMKVGDGKLSPLVKAGIGEGPTASKISKAINYVENWDDFTPASLDNLQQALTTIGAKPGTREFVFIDKLKKGVQAVVKEKYPEYTKLLSDYTDASGFIDEIEGAIGAGNRADVEKVVLKMSQTMKTGNMRFEIKNSFVKQLEEMTGLPLRERIAGMSLAEYYPRGLAKVGAGLGTAGAVGVGGLSVFTAPSFWMAVGMSSPRVVGEVLGAIGVAKSYIPTVVDALKSVMPFDDVLRMKPAMSSKAQSILPEKSIGLPLSNTLEDSSVIVNTHSPKSPPK